jgi:hypothetical protein
MNRGVVAGADVRAALNASLSRDGFRQGLNQP